MHRDNEFSAGDILDGNPYFFPVLSGGVLRVQEGRNSAIARFNDPFSLYIDDATRMGVCAFSGGWHQTM